MEFNWEVKARGPERTMKVFVKACCVYIFNNCYPCANDLENASNMG